MARVQKNPFSHLEQSLPTFAGLKTISLDSPVTQYGIQATTAVAGSWFGGLWKNLHIYFDVSNKYVIKKLELINFPFLFKSEWDQELGSDGLPGSPRANLYAPDLYIPLMSFITFVLISGLKSGLYGKFTPQVLGLTASSSIIILFFEIVLVYGGFYFLQNSLPSVLDLVAYCGYKFVPCVWLAVIHIFLSSEVYYIGLVYCSVMFGMFFVRDI